MGRLLKVLLVIATITTLGWGIDMKIKQENYRTNANIWIKITDLPGNDNDWIGIYPKGVSSHWGNQVAWGWAKEPSPYKDWYTFNTSKLPIGEYEARFFLKNGYHVEKKISFSIKNTVVLSTKDTYKTDEAVRIEINNQSASLKNWVGIFPVGSSNTWGNQIVWKWSTGENNLDFGMLSSGEYEARIFYNNSFRLENSVYFTVENSAVKMISNKAQYSTIEQIQLNITNQAPDNKNWIGVYPQGSTNAWANVLDWKWTNGDNTIRLDTPGVGNYEARLFYNNSFKLEDKVGFSASDNAYVYGSEGPYLDKVKVDNSHDKYIVYYPEGHVQNAPLVLFAGYENTIKGPSANFRLEGMMKYVASLGCYVIGHKQINGNNNDKLNTGIRRTYFIDAVNEAKAKGVDTSKLGIVGKSAGGMHAYALMEYFKGKNHGADKRFIIDVIGYLPLNMNKEQLKALNIDTLILHYGMKNNNYNGVQTKYPQDPRVLLTVAHILKHGDNKVGFIPIATANHSYEGGDYDNFKTKRDLMKHIDAMIKYELFNENGQYNNASDILFSGYEQTRNKTIQDTINHLARDESEDQSKVIYYEDVHKTKTPCNKNYNNINYCQDYK